MTTTYFYTVSAGLCTIAKDGLVTWPVELGINRAPKDALDRLTGQVANSGVTITDLPFCN